MAVKVHVVDKKKDGQAWLAIYEGQKRTYRKVGDWDEARALKKEIEIEFKRRRAGLPDRLSMRVVLEAERDRHIRHLKHSTRALQEGQIENHLIPGFGHLDAREVSKAVVREWVEQRLQSHSVSSVRSCTNLLSKVFRRLKEEHPEIELPTAGLHRLYSQIDVSQATEIRAIDSWTQDEASKLLEITRRLEPRYYPVILALLHTGCRRGEVLGLQWGDIDLERGRLLVRRARVNSRTVLPKHRGPKDAPRSVKISPALADVLRGLQTFEWAKAGREDVWVFASRSGTPIEETTLSRAWVRIRTEAAKHGVRPLTLHSLRHTFATLSLEAGRSVKWVAGQLGHRDAAVTLNTYAHALADDEQDLGYLPVAGAGTHRHQTGTKPLLRRHAKR